MTFYERFTQLCEEKNVSPSAVSEAIGLSNSSATYWKRGSIPKFETVKKIAKFFDVPVTDFFDEEDVEDAKETASIAYPNDPEKAADTEEWTLLNALPGQYDKIIDKARDQADAMYVSLVKDVSDEYIKEQIIDCLNYLSRRGKLEALDLVYQLTENYRFNKRLN